MLAVTDVMQAKEANGLVKKNQSRLLMSYDKDIDRSTALNDRGTLDSTFVHLSNYFQTIVMVTDLYLIYDLHWMDSFLSSH